MRKIAAQRLHDLRERSEWSMLEASIKRKRRSEMIRSTESAQLPLGADTEQFSLDFTRSNRGAHHESSTCGKQAAISAYCWGVLSIEGCARLFQRHLDWRGA